MPLNILNKLIPDDYLIYVKEHPRQLNDNFPDIRKKHFRNGKNGILITPDKDITIHEFSKDAVPVPKVVVNPLTQELQKPKEIDPIKLSEAIVFLADNLKMRKLYGNNLYKKFLNRPLPF